MSIDDRPFPRAPLAGAGLLLALTLLTVGAARSGLVDVSTRPDPAGAAAPEASRDLRFYDRADGAVVIEDASGAEAAIVEPGSGGFIRGVVRGLARDRKARGLGPEPVFRLTRWSDDRLTLEDTATGRRLELTAFGPTNKDAFAALLPVGGRT
jgi:putative photosynthetic complex assembly protein